MKLILFLLACGLLVISCKEKAASDSASIFEALTVDSLMLQNDSIVELQGLTEEDIPEDELFDDFIYNFSTDKALQRKRVRFPLEVKNNADVDSLSLKNWKHDWLFYQDNFYTLIFDKEEDMELIGDLAIDTAGIEWINIIDRQIKRYSFKRENGTWFLESIVERPIESADNDGFFSFFHRFVTDSAYQAKMVRRPLKFVTIDPDDDFSVLETTLDINQWFAFRPELPVGTMTNIDYGQRNKTGSATKIVAMKGVDNGFSNMFYFRRKSGDDWELYKFEDISM